jgi:hypothetical protein
LPRKFTEHPFWEKKVDVKRGLSFIMDASDEKWMKGWGFIHFR